MTPARPGLSNFLPRQGLFFRRAMTGIPFARVFSHLPARTQDGPSSSPCARKLLNRGCAPVKSLF